MEILAVIIGSLALLAALANNYLIHREEKRNEKRKAAALHYTDEIVRQFSDMIFRRCAELEGEIAALQEQHEELVTKYDQLNDRCGDLEKGAVPDFEKAKEAANAVNDFNAGITGILGFDPMEAIKKQREAVNE